MSASTLSSLAIAICSQRVRKSHPTISIARLLASGPRPFAQPNLLCRGNRRRHLINRGNTKENMIDHVILTVSDFKRSADFYAQALKPLGITALSDYEGKDGHPDLKGFGIGKSHFFWLKEGKPDPQAVH